MYRHEPLSIPRVTKQNRVHDAAWIEGEQACDDQTANEQPDHGASMAVDHMAVCREHGKRKRDQHIDRQQVDWAPGAPYPQLVNEQRARGDQKYERDPNPADTAMRPRSFRGSELKRADRKRRDRREGVDLNGRAGIEQGSECHGQRRDLDRLYDIPAARHINPTACRAMVARSAYPIRSYQPEQEKPRSSG